MLRRLSTITLCLAACASAALAQGSATLQDKVGTVLVNGGTGFVPAAEGARLAPTDRVLVQMRGAAFLVYSDGCRTKLRPGQTVMVGSTSCAEGRELADLPNRAAAPIMPPLEPVAGGAAFGVVPIVGGVVIVGAGIGAAIALANRSNGENFYDPNRHRGMPISP